MQSSVRLLGDNAQRTGMCPPGFRDRVLGNPRFLVVLAIEFAMGASAKWSAEVQARGDKFWPVRRSRAESVSL